MSDGTRRSAPYATAPGRVQTSGAGIVLRVPRRSGRWMMALVLACVCVGLFVGSSGYSYRPLGDSDLPGGKTASSSELEGEVSRDLVSQLRGERQRLLRRWSNVGPRETYIVIDRTNNRLALRRRKETLLETDCSAGSGNVLIDDSGNRKWVFDTPTGVFRVRMKIDNPVWKKPDWAFLEEGHPPPVDPSDRFDYGALGEYALDFGDGYLIHGTLYERLIGRGVTHGCVRLGREDLRKVFHQAKPGTQIFIH